MDVIRTKYAALEPFLNERTRRLWAAAEAKALGRGGQALIAAATHLSRTTLYRGLRELSQPLEGVPDPRIRAGSGGRKRLTEQAGDVLEVLQGLIKECTCGDPESPFAELDTNKS